MLYSPLKDKNGNKLFPLLSPWERLAETFVLAILIVMFSVLSNAVLNTTALVTHSYYSLYIIMPAIAAGVILHPLLVRLYAQKRGKAFGTREERMAAFHETPALTQIAVTTVGWGFSMFLIMTTSQVIEYGWPPMMVGQNFLIWMGAGLFVGILGLYQAKS